MNSPSAYEKYIKTVEGPYTKLRILCRPDNEPPPKEWFVENDNCYVYHLGGIYLTQPAQFDYTIPTRYVDYVYSKLTAEGYSVSICK